MNWLRFGLDKHKRENRYFFKAINIFKNFLPNSTMKLLLLMESELICSDHTHLTTYDNNTRINTKHCTSIISSFHVYSALPTIIN